MRGAMAKTIASKDVTREKARGGSVAAAFEWLNVIKIS
jgi:hypothetical protein